MEGKANRQIYINPHHIEYLETEHKTIITLLSGKKYAVQESPEELIDRIIKYRQKIGVFGNQEE